MDPIKFSFFQHWTSLTFRTQRSGLPAHCIPQALLDPHVVILPHPS